jgi:hypothetical protein
MSTSATLPNTIQMRPSRLTGLVVGVAILTGVATWSASQVTTSSHTSGTPRTEAVSTSPATKAYVDGVVALSPAQRAAVYGNVALSQPSIGSVNARSPELQSVDIPQTPFVGSLNAHSPELQAVDIPARAYVDSPAIADWARAQGLTGLSPASVKSSPASVADAIAALPHDQLVAMYGYR